MKKFLVSLAAIGGLAVAAPQMAEAYPSSCSVAVGGNRAAATCWGGSGRFQVVAYTWYGRVVGGPCMPVGYISTVYVDGLLRASWRAC